MPEFSGSRFERFAGGGDRVGVTNEFTSDDLVAVTLLSVNIPGQTSLRILGDRDLDYRNGLSTLLRQIPTDIELVDASDEVLEKAEALWSQVRQNHDVGRTKTSKLLARKRPHLLPVIDSVVTTAVGHVPGKHSFYRNLRAALNADDRRLHSHLIALRDKADVGDDISAIRVFDILAWMWGSGRSPVDETDTRQPATSSITEHEPEVLA
ncbi:hypothetical protein A5766_00125 [Gordonia sp. 852002-51296_SCH5728562-b]|nr:hypothetical protein A5766_00125 [Gordonia sp. 852002-51296_SCH5728562-b]